MIAPSKTKLINNKKKLSHFILRSHVFDLNKNTNHLFRHIENFVEHIVDHHCTNKNILIKFVYISIIIRDLP